MSGGLLGVSEDTGGTKEVLRELLEVQRAANRSKRGSGEIR